MTAAAFFDLDRTLLRRSSALALAGSFREHGVIGRRQLAKAAAWQLLFVARGASAEAVRTRVRGRADDPARASRVDELRTLVADAMEPVLKPLVYREPLELVDAPPRPRRAGLHRLGDAAGDRRGARARARLRRRARLVCEIEDGVYTGRSLRVPATARRRPRRSASSPTREDIDLAASTAYSDSHTDLPFLEAVGNPVAVNPDRDAPPRRGRARLAGARVQRARLPGAAAAPRSSGSRSRWAAPRLGRPRVRPEERARRALGFRRRDAATLFDHFDDAERRGKLGHGHSRIDVAGDAAGPRSRRRGRRRRPRDPGFDRWDGRGALGYLDARGDLRRQLAEPPAARAGRRRRRLLPDRAARLLGALARRGRPRRGC